MKQQYDDDPLTATTGSSMPTTTITHRDVRRKSQRQPKKMLHWSEFSWIFPVLACLFPWQVSPFAPHLSSFRHTKYPDSQASTKLQKQLIQHRLKPLAASVAPTSSTPFSSSSSSSSNNNHGSSGSVGKTKQQQRRQLKQEIRQLFSRAQYLERKGLWLKASNTLHTILEMDPTDAHSHLALARLEARRFPNSSRAVEAFRNGTAACPESIHLWQAWAVHEDALGNYERAQQLYECALKLDPYNPYVCHAYGRFLEKQASLTASRSAISTSSSSSNDPDNSHSNANEDDASAAARSLWERALEKRSTAALVCSLGAAYIARNENLRARALYEMHWPRLANEKERTEVALAAAWLEERYLGNWDRAEEWLRRPCAQPGVSSSSSSGNRTHTASANLAHVALARLQGRRQQQQQQQRNSHPNSAVPANALGGDDRTVRQATVRQLAKVCRDLENNNLKVIGNPNKNSQDAEWLAADGRVYNAWANLEVKARRYKKARSILRRGLDRYPRDFSLLQAAGKMEERMGNYTGARYLYRSSLCVQPSAPCLVAIALLELRHPQSSATGMLNLTQVKRLFEEALLLDPRHGPAYNAYARCVFERERDEEQARAIFNRGVRAHCPDAASLYHGYAKLELAVGNVERARELLLEGRREARLQEIGKDSPHRERVLFLTHTLGMLELNSNRPVQALDVFLDGVERYGNSSQLLLGAALCEVKLGNMDEARQLFERSVVNDEKHAHAWQAWGVMEMRAGNYKTAKTLFECGIKSAPRHGPLWQAYAIMESRLGNIEEARALFEKGIVHSPNHVSLYQGWASMELREGEFQRAKTLITQALTLDKRNGAGWLIAADIEKRLDHVGLGKLLLRRGIECAPNNSALYKALGDVLIGESKIQEAREIYEKGIEVDPLHAPLYHSLAELEARVCNLEGLSKLHRRAAAIFQTNALIPPPAASELWASKIRAGRNHSVPREVAALAERIADDDGGGDGDFDAQGVDPASILDRMSSNLLEDGLRNLLNMEEEQ